MSKTIAEEFADQKRTEEQSLVFLKALWVQKQLDDLLLARESVKRSLKGDPLNIRYRSMLGSIEYDISLLQPIAIEVSGGQCARIIEDQFKCKFKFIHAPEKKSSILLSSTPGES